MAKLTLIFSDGDTSSVGVDRDETLLAAAKRGGVKLASDCEMGDCQTCRARIVAGKATHDPDTILSLSDQEVLAGDVLLCVANADGDVAVQLPYERASLLPTRTVNLEVQAVEQLCDSVMRLSARVTGRIPLTFLPGQYLNMKVPGTDQWRSYSMANAAGEAGPLEFLIRILDQGVMSEFLKRRVAPGDAIEANGPFGTFYLRDAKAKRPLLMVAGGTGVAPIAAMLRTMKTTGDNRAITLCFGVTQVHDLFYVEELQKLAAELPDLALRIAVMTGDSSPYANGTAVDLIKREDAIGHDIYLCGPPAMTDGARTMLTGLGIPADSILTERFVAVGES